MHPLLSTIYTASPQRIYRYFAGRRRFARAQKVIETYINTAQTRKLHIGCGGNFLEGWLNSDLVPEDRRIAMLDASQPFPIPNNSFQFAYSEHVFEHLNFQGQLNYLKESLRILNPGGRLRIATPDFDKIISLTHAENPIRNEYLNWNFDHFLKKLPARLKENAEVYVLNNYFRDWGHQLIHNKSSLKQLLEFIGFKEVVFGEVGESDEPGFRNLEQHDKMITDRFNRFETMILEATKEKD